MSYILSYNSISYTEIKILSRFGGSSKYRVIDDELITVEKKKTEPKISTVNNEKLKIDSDLDTNKSDHLEPDTDLVNEKDISLTEVEKKTYKLNKSKLKKKCHAFSRLKKSSKFLAFYSISFPNGLTDEFGYQIFNTWLTRCRKNCNLNSYIWVAERQKNGTIHFHLLTNDFMPIKTVNGFMSKALKTYKNRGIEALKEVDTEKYNGIDVKKVGNNKKGLISYLAKYISKNDIAFYRLPWHCSRDVSRLFTSSNYNEENVDECFNQLEQDQSMYEIFYRPFCVTWAMKYKPTEKVYSDLDGVNEIIYKS